MARRLAVLLLAVAIIAALAPEAAANVPFPKRVPKDAKCPNLPPKSDAAYKALKNCVKPECFKFGDVLKVIEDYDLWDTVKKVAKGKCLVLPTNHALSSRFARLGLYLGPGNIPKSAVKAFEKFLKVGVAVKCNTIPASYKCTPIYANHEFGVKNRRLATINPKSYGFAGLSTAGKPPTQEELENSGVEFTYSVLGTGYNLYKGMPSGSGLSAVDPGMTLVPLFNLTKDMVRSISTTGAACKSQFSSTISSSVDAYTRQIGASLGIEIKVSKITAQVNGEFQMISQNIKNEQSRTISSQAQVFLGGYGLASGLGGMALDRGFYYTVEPLMEAALANREDPFALQSVVDGYGTHYIKTVFWGGMAASVTQMSSSDLMDLESFNISGNASIQVQGLANASASVKFGQTSLNEVRSRSTLFKQTLIPSAVPLAITYSRENESDPNSPQIIPSVIDCVEWTKRLMDYTQTKGWRAPIEYSTGPLWGLFSYPRLFDNETCGAYCKGWKPALSKVASQVYNYIQTCGYIAADFDRWLKGEEVCPGDDPETKRQNSACVIGTYKSDTSSTGCGNCFDTNVGPGCNATVTLTCTKYACYCKPAYANNTQCVNLSPNPPAPPAPSMSDLARRRRAL